MKFPRAKLLSITLFIVSFNHTTVLRAASEFSDGLVPAELVRDITGRDVFKGVPDGFPLPAVPIPDDISLRLLGSVDSGFTQELYLRTNSSGEAVNEALLDAYAASGWTDVSSAPGSGASVTTVPLYTSLCHDELGSLDIRSNGTAGGENRILISYRPDSPVPGLFGASSCEELRAYIDAGYPSGIYSYFSTLFPMLEAPEQAPDPAPGLSLSPSFFNVSRSPLSGGSFQTSRSGTITVPDTNLSELHEFYVGQLEEQGWEEDSNAAGTAGFSSIWLKTAPGPDIPGIDGDTAKDIDLTGILTILDNGDGSYQIMFQMFSN